MRPGLCREDHQLGVGVLGERPHDGLQTRWEAGAHRHVTQTWKTMYLVK